MKKALIVGGSNGIGLSLSKKLIDRGYFIEIFDCVKPNAEFLSESDYKYTYCDLRDFKEDIFDNLVNDKDLDTLFLTAGIGRIADFEAHHLAEIDKIMTVDAVSAIKILRIFWQRISGNDSFYTGVMGSISGWLSSPAASVYSAAKSALVRCVESINIELEASGTVNRILDVSPASFKGSRFYGGDNQLNVLEPLSDEILHHFFERDCLYIPSYNEIFKSVLERYHDAPHEYGLYSYEYKRKSDRYNNDKKVIIGYLSGTFDLFHVGHLNLLRNAKSKCDYLIVGVHDSGKWKGKETFIPLDERKAIVAACKYVDKVVDSCIEDSDAWNLWHYDRLFVGSDYKGTERFKKYESFFKDKNVEIVYFPYTQSTSSTMIRKTVLLKTKDIVLS